MKKKIAAFILGISVLALAGFNFGTPAVLEQQPVNEQEVAINLLEPRPMSVEEEGVDVAINIIGPGPMSVEDGVDVAINIIGPGPMSVPVDKNAIA